MGTIPIRRLLALAVVCLTATPLLAQANTSSSSTVVPTAEQMKTFLKNAKVIAAKESQKGITHPTRLTLSDGTTTHDGSFQSVDERKSMMDLGNGRMEMNFVDSYKYNIAAYELAELLGLGDMIPVYVERKWKGRTGSLSWWLPVKMDEADRVAKKIEIPEDARERWNKQMYKIRVFDQLVSDSDPNLTNVLIGNNWEIWRVDFSRAFRLAKEPPIYKNLDHCDRQLFEKLKSLDANEFTARSRDYLTRSEIKAVMQRRDKIVEYIQKQVAEKGEGSVLY